jgi:hypothetical protein
MPRLLLDMTRAAEMRRGRGIYHKIIVGFWRFECLTRQHEKNCCIHSAARPRGYNAGLHRAHAFAFRQPT